MKKILSVILSVLMIVTCTVPAFSVSAAAENYPIIVLRGDGTQIYVPDENAPDGERNIWGDAFTNIEGGSVTESVANILLPFLTEGLLFDKWDNYYDRTKLGEGNDGNEGGRAILHRGSEREKQRWTQ